jgi:hypothetical protein
VTKDDYSWSQHDLVDGDGQEENNKDGVVHPDDVGIEMDTKEDNGLPASPVAKQLRDIDDDVKVEPQEHNLQGMILCVYTVEVYVQYAQNRFQVLWKA